MQIKYVHSRKIWKIEWKHNEVNKTDCKSCCSDNITFRVLMCISSLPYFVWILNFIFWMCNSQERNRAFPAPSEARLLREAGHEGHPHRPAHDLHPPPHVHRDLHEEVSVRGLPRGRPSRTRPVTNTPHLTLADRGSSFSSILPFEAVVCMYRFLGADKCMYPFIAQRKQATNNNEAKNGIWGSFLYRISFLPEDDQDILVRPTSAWLRLSGFYIRGFFFFFSNQLFTKINKV